MLTDHLIPDDLDAALGLILGVLLGMSFWAVVIRIVECFT